MPGFSNDIGIMALIHPMDEKLDLALRRIRPKSILDIGTQDGFTLQVLFQRYPFIDHVEGWEIETEESVIANILKFNGQKNAHLKYDSLFGRYQQIFDEVEDGWRPALTSESEFKERIRLVFEKDVREQNPIERFDLVIASNLFNTMFPRETSKSWKVIRGSMSQGGHVYVHHRAKPDYSIIQLDHFDSNEHLCQEHARELQLDRFEFTAANRYRHITYTNLLSVTS